MFSLALLRNSDLSCRKVLIVVCCSNSRNCRSSFNRIFFPINNSNGVVPILRLYDELIACCTLSTCLYQSSGFDKDNLVRIAMMERFILSTCPLARGTPVVVSMCSMSSVAQYSSKEREVNAVPLSVMI